ncbi:hypothetical protein LINPERHAP1_LOCUS854 [Linum perenne]
MGAASSSGSRRVVCVHCADSPCLETCQHCVWKHGGQGV